MMQSIPRPTSVNESHAALFGKVTLSVWQKHQMPKTVFFVPKREPQFLNNSDPTHKFTSTLTKMSEVPAETDPISTGVQSKRPPSNHESLNDKKQAQHKD